jgi:hypothetical protein
MIDRDNRLRSMRCIFGVGIVAFVLSVVATRSTSADEVKTRIVFAHHMHCFVFGAISASDARVSHPEGVRDLKNWPPIEFESQWFAADRSARAAAGITALREDFYDAEQAGIDAFALLVAPGHLPRSQFSVAFDLMALTAVHHKVKIIPELWADSRSANMSMFGAEVKAFMDRHPQALLRLDGKPMIILATGYDNGADHEPTEIAKRHLGDLLESLGGRDNLYIVGYGINFAKNITRESTASPIVSTSDAIAMWAPQDDWWGRQATASLGYARSVNKPYAFPVSPAFYQRRAGKAPWEYSVNYGAARYIDGWMRAIESRSAFVNVQTWDDFSENSAISNTNTAGRSWLELTRYLAGWFKSGQPPSFEQEQVFLFHPKQLVNAQLDQADARVSSPRFRHRGGLADYIDVVTILKTPADVTIAVGQDSWSFQAPSGLHEWTIYAPAQVDGSIVLGFESRPERFVQNSPWRKVKRVRSFDSSTPVVEITRNGERVRRLESRAGYLNRGVFQDLSIIGDVGILDTAGPVERE